MISKILKTYAEKLNEFLSRYHSQPEGLAEVSAIGNNGGVCPNKIVVSLINPERETSGGHPQSTQVGMGGFTSGTVPLLLNLNIIMAAVYDSKKYSESLSVFSTALAFIQANPKIEIDKNIYTLELVSLSPHEHLNMWATMGNQYYPSVVCKLRKVVIDAGEIKRSGTTADNTIIQT